jgi:hypothetical protein
MQSGAHAGAAQIFLPVHLRILLQPLHHHVFPDSEPLQTLFNDWRGYLLALFALVWVANQYMSIYARLRLDIQHERIAIKTEEKKEARLPAGRAA